MRAAGRTMTMSELDEIGASHIGSSPIYVVYEGETDPNCTQVGTAADRTRYAVLRADATGTGVEMEIVREEPTTYGDAALDLLATWLDGTISVATLKSEAKDLLTMAHGGDDAEE